MVGTQANIRMPKRMAKTAWGDRMTIQCDTCENKLKNGEEIRKCYRGHHELGTIATSTGNPSIVCENCWNSIRERIVKISPETAGILLQCLGSDKFRDFMGAECKEAYEQLRHAYRLIDPMILGVQVSP